MPGLALTDSDGPNFDFDSVSEVFDAIYVQEVSVTANSTTYYGGHSREQKFQL